MIVSFIVQIFKPLLHANLIDGEIFRCEKNRIEWVIRRVRRVDTYIITRIKTSAFTGLILNPQILLRCAQSPRLSSANARQFMRRCSLVYIIVSLEILVLGTIPARSSKTLVFARSLRVLLFVSDDISSIRDFPSEGAIVLEIVPSTLNRLIVTPFSRFHHTSLPSTIMNLDPIISPRVKTPKPDGKILLNRTLSTAVPSPISTPNRQPSSVSSSVTARAACVLASSLQSWRQSDDPIPAKKVLNSLLSRPLEAVKRGRFGECLVLVGGLMVSVGHLDVEWQSSRIPVDFSDEYDVTLSKREMYRKLRAAAMNMLACGQDSSRSDILKSVGTNQSDMAILLSGAVLLNDVHDTSTNEVGNPLYLQAPPCLIVS